MGMELFNFLIFLISSILVLSAFLLLYFSRSPKSMEGIPGSLGWPIVGESFSFISDFSSPSGIFSFMKKRQQRYGKVFKSFVLGRYTVFMTGREASKILLTGKDGIVSLNLFYTGQQVLGPTSLLQSTGEAHKRLRRIIAEPLSMDGHRPQRRYPASNMKRMDELFLSSDTNVSFEQARDSMYAMLDSIISRRRSGEEFQQDFLESFAGCRP